MIMARVKYGSSWSWNILPKEQKLAMAQDYKTQVEECLWFSWYQMMVAGEDTPESYLKDGVDWIFKNLLLAIELLITGTVFQITVLVALR